MRPYILLLFLKYLFRHEISKLPPPIAVKLCHDAIWMCFIIQAQKFGGPPPKKLRAQNMQNLGQFYTTSDFDREYPKSES